MVNIGLYEFEYRDCSYPRVENYGRIGNNPGICGHSSLVKRNFNTFKNINSSFIVAYDKKKLIFVIKCKKHIYLKLTNPIKLL